MGNKAGSPDNPGPWISNLIHKLLRKELPKPSLPPLVTCTKDPTVCPLRGPSGDASPCWHQAKPLDCFHVKNIVILIIALFSSLLCQLQSQSQSWGPLYQLYITYDMYSIWSYPWAISYFPSMVFFSWVVFVLIFLPHPPECSLNLF